MSELTRKVDDSQLPAKIQKKFRKGDLVKVDRETYSNSLESKASDTNLPEYIFQGPGEVLLIKGDYCQVRWRRPVPDVWIKTDHIVSY
ncbi:NAD(P)H-quinone oxidoreductase subunit O [Prochlorococcus marinus]|uniref:NAD(P)H-quinone oxidoreductase subunit O n=1 Tax=Prochlorococcus marinus TaxID=1219 RepID=UPI0022B5A424|nr:NAD(P)H-quinone oxidoreductase subunit O [Prochlorococcus marinus]